MVTMLLFYVERVNTLQMTEIIAAVLHTTLQSVTGLAVGTIVDSLMPDPGPPLVANSTEIALWTGLEVAAQLTVTGLVSAAVVQASESLPREFSDPTGGIAFMLVLMASMPNMNEKIKRLALYGRSELGMMTHAVVDEARLVEGSLNTGNRFPVSRSQKQMANANI